MKQMKTRRLRAVSAGVLCACLMGSLLPVTAAAAEEHEVVCLGATCILEGCTCPCHVAPVETTAVPETTSATVPVTVIETVPATTEATVPATTEATVPATSEATVPPTTEETVPPTTVETVPPTTVETVPPATEETVPETKEETEPALVNPVAMVWLDQNGNPLMDAEGSLLGAPQVEAGVPLTEEHFPALSQVGWYLVDAEGTLTDTPVKVGHVVEQNMTLRAVDRSVSLSLTGECTVGSDVILTATLTGFAGEEVTIQWQNCPMEGEEIWTDVEGATGPEYVYTIPEDAVSMYWRAVVTVS